MNWAESFLAYSASVKWGNSTYSTELLERLNQARRCIEYPTQSPTKRRCLAMVFIESEFAQTLDTQMQEPQDGNSLL
jgi:hypothetical protein